MGRGFGVLWLQRRSGAAITVGLAFALTLPVAARADVLPDGRVYEQVSPVVKNGFDAGAPNGIPKYAVATADGSGLLFGTRGPMGTVHRGLQDYAIGRRGAEGWSSESALPAGSSDRIYAISYAPSAMMPSEDLKRIVFGAFGSYVPDNPVTVGTSAALYEGHADGTIDWLTRPRIPDPAPAPGRIGAVSFFQPLGASPDLSTMYFWSGPTLLPSDAARAPFYNPADPDAAGPWGLYEYSGGVLRSAGTLPDGTESPGGAAPAASGGSYRVSNNFTTPEVTGNQVSRDGSTLLFVSPDPGPDPAFGPSTQLYVRRGGHSTLVSHTAGGAPAPSGVSPVAPLNGHPDPRAHSYAYGAEDGKSAIFRSVDALTPDAPADTSVKTYSYDIEGNTVSYLAGVSGTIVAASDDNRRFLFGDQTQIAVWDDGTVRTIASVGVSRLSPARATASGSTFLFSTPSAIPGFNSGGVVQVYRYDVGAGKTTCLSCPPDGVTPTGDANLTNQDTATTQPTGEVVPARGMSDDADRVFFDTPDALVPRDTNGSRRDVYEWTPSGMSLISSGRSQDDSFFLDNSADGNDVFFATAEGLDADDTDGAYDVYDARVGGGFKKVDQAAPCAGDGCQGGVAGAPPVPVPGSAGFSGPQNQQPPDDRAKPAPSSKLKLGARRLVDRTLEVTVTIARPGRVTVSGSGLRGVSRTITKTGATKLRVALTPTAKRSLARKGRLRLSVRVGFTPKSGTASSVKFVLNAKA